MSTEDPLNHLARGFLGLALNLAQRDPGREPETISRELAPPFTNMTRVNWLKALDLWLSAGAHLVSEQPDRNCPACGHRDVRHLFSSYDGYPFVDCLNCGCWYTPKVVDGSLFSRFFDRCPEARALARSMTADRLEVSRAEHDRKHFGRLLDEVLSLSGTDASYLDVGCGVGHSLVAASERGLKAVGLEADPDCVELGQEQALDIRHVSLGVPNGPFDIISIWETLEHVSDPGRLLEQLRPALSENGLLTVLVPNLDSPSVRLLRGDCSVVHGGMNGPGHINFFHPDGLEALVRRAGFVVLDQDGLFADDPFEFAAYLLGQSRGAFDMVVRGRDRVVFSRRVETILNTVWPAITEIERATLTTPLIRVIACRSGSEARFTTAIQSLRERKRAATMDRLEWMAKPYEGDEASITQFLTHGAISWRNLPAPASWTCTPGVAALAEDRLGSEIQGDDSPFGYQLVSPPVTVRSNTELAIFAPLFEISGRVGLGVLDAQGQWLVPPVAGSRPILVRTAKNTSITVVVANM